MNTQINITENGTTTLATAGKYCDRNIDVNVNVPSNDEQLRAIATSIIDKTLAGEYVNNDTALVGEYVFSYCTNLESVSFLNAQKVNVNAFSGCAKLRRAEFRSFKSDTLSTTSFLGNSFRNCTSLESLIIRGTVVARLADTTAFTGSAIANGTGFIYVTDDLVGSYKTATNWSNFADQIKPISELEE